MRQNRFGTLLFVVTLLVAATPVTLAASGRYRAYVGTYTTGESKGVYSFDYDARSGHMTSLQLAAETTNPSFVVVSKDGHFLYAVNELGKYEGKSSGGVSAFSVDIKTGKLTFLNEVASGGADPCYISFDKTGKFLLVANYTGGSVAVFPVGSDGRLGEASSVIQHAGKGPNQERQEGPHAHWIEVTPDNRYAIAVDLGLDELLVYKFDAVKGVLSANQPAFGKVDAGAGPRHFALHANGRFGYVVDELKSSVDTLTFDGKEGVLEKIQTVSTLPAGFSGKNDTAELEIHPNGKFIYASNRGHDSIVVYAIDPKSGMLKLVEDVSTQGKTPRNFVIDPRGTHLLVANQESGTIVVFNLNPKTGRLTPSGEVLKVPVPVCIRFAEVQ